MKRILALTLALIMILGLATTASAATANVTVEKTGHTYEAYQILTGTQDATETALGNVAWGSGMAANSAAFLAELKANATVGETFKDAVDAKTFAEAMANLTSNSEGAKIVAAIADKHKVAGSGIELKVGDNTLADGYYLIVDTTNVSGQHDSKNASLLEVTRDITIADKSSIPEVDKQVHDEEADAEAGHTNGWGETADHAMNESFQFKLIATLSADTDYAEYETYKVIFTDTMSAGVTFDSIASVTVDGVTLTSGQYTCTATAGQAGGSWKLTIADIKAFEGVNLVDGAVVEVIYNAHLNENAVVGNSDANKNTVYLEYSNNPNVGGENDLGKTKEDTVWVFTYKMDNNKVDGNEQPLGGAGFKLYSDAGCTTEIPVIFDSTLNAYRLTKGEEVGVEMFSAETTGVFNIVGLDVGTYYLKETTTPAGYNTCPVVTVVITATHAEAASETTAATEIVMTQDGTATSANKIVNNSGTVLPETGGIGTTIFYTLGGLMVIAAAVLLVTKKRMASAE